MKIGVYTPRKSVLHSLDVRSRFFLLLVAVPIAGFLGDLKIVLFLICMLPVLVKLSRISFRTFWDIVKLFVISIPIALVILCVFLSSGSLSHRVYIGLLYSAKIDIFVASGVLFAMTTNPNDIPQALMKMKIPHRYGIAVMLGLRLYPTLLQKARTIMDAQRCRGIELKSLRHPKSFINSLTLLLIPLIIATLEAGASLGDTLSARGYDPYEPITLSPLVRMRLRDYFLIAMGVLLLVLSYLKL